MSEHASPILPLGYHQGQVSTRTDTSVLDVVKNDIAEALTKPFSKDSQSGTLRQGKA
jgi:hypothetical protein